VSLPSIWEKGSEKIITDIVKHGVRSGILVLFILLMIVLQVPINLDVNSGNPIGVGITPNFASGGLRTTSASASLKDVPPNLHIWTDATVSKVIFEGTDAVGVETVDGRKGTLNSIVIILVFVELIKFKAFARTKSSLRPALSIRPKSSCSQELVLVTT
jgi:choline dehydrogenase-like flavoprotein